MILLNLFQNCSTKSIWNFTSINHIIGIYFQMHVSNLTLRIVAAQVREAVLNRKMGSTVRINLNGREV
jgi:hypothetical protein